MYLILNRDLQGANVRQNVRTLGCPTSRPSLESLRKLKRLLLSSGPERFPWSTLSDLIKSLEWKGKLKTQNQKNRHLSQ